MPGPPQARAVQPAAPIHTVKGQLDPRRGVAAVAALVLVAISLRPQLVGISPLIPRMQEELGSPFGVMALATAIPLCLMGILAPASASFAARIGFRRATGIGLSFIAVLGCARVLVGDFGVFLALTSGVGLGIAVAGTLLPMAVKQWFPHRPATATAIYAAAIQIGAAGASAIAIPLADAFGSWRVPLLAFSIVGWLSLLGWNVLSGVIGDMPPKPQPHRVSRRLSRSVMVVGATWLLVGTFSLLSITYYGFNAWLPAYLIERGSGEADAGGLLAVMNVMAIPATIAVALTADQRGSRRRYLMAGSAALIAATLGLMSGWGPSLFWVSLAGTSFGGIFPIVLTLPVDAGRTAARVATIAGTVFGVGYLVAAASPVTLGVIRDATGSFQHAFLILIVVELLLLLVSSLITPTRLMTAQTA